MNESGVETGVRESGEQLPFIRRRPQPDPGPVSSPPALPAQPIPLPGSPLHSLCPAYPSTWLPAPSLIPSLTPSPSPRFPSHWSRPWP
ncbi:vegetative cell wall protein gp1-like isoform X2 [Thunnus maccoyii]|uniref:vegetative cell wall protein gp1-like isoform X2 n=1 Tax=Thunnus maccoyii TaxID=8240 RepID=UPI001C4DB4FD|nr:vegetative cell wall protein gp1-like isoform X2 [Thunnus maccoyii]